MLAVYRRLLALYPLEYRRQFADEMAEVFVEIRAEKQHESLMQQGVFFVCELAGIVSGALRERLRSLGAHSGLPVFRRRFCMRDRFRFPKATAILMAIILAGVVIAIKKGEDISASLPHVGAPVGPIQPVHSTLLSPLPMLFAAFYILGLAGWGILFALRRSGVHRLDEMGTRKS